MELKKKRKYTPLQSNEDFVKYRKGRMTKDTLYKARHHKKQKKLNLKGYYTTNK